MKNPADGHQESRFEERNRVDGIVESLRPKEPLEVGDSWGFCAEIADQDPRRRRNDGGGLHWSLNVLILARGCFCCFVFFFIHVCRGSSRALANDGAFIIRDLHFSQLEQTFDGSKFFPV